MASPGQEGTSAPSVSANSSEWDTVFAIPAAQANAAIRRHNAAALSKDPARPQCIDYTGKSGALSASFGDWQITNGGGDYLICFCLPLRDVRLQLGTSDVHTFAEGTAIAEVNFQMLPPPPHPATQPSKTPEGTQHDLRIVGPQAAIAHAVGGFDVQPSVVRVLRLQLQDNDDGFLETVAANYLTAWLEVHLDLFDAVVSTVTLNTLEDSGRFAFLRPIYTNYAFTPSDSGGILAVLCLCEGSTRDPHSLAQQVSVAAIAPGHQCGFLISRRRLLAELILPVLPRNFPGTDGDFVLNDAGDAIDLRGATYCSVVTADGKSYDGVLEMFHLALQGPRITIESQTLVQVSPGIRSRCRNFSSHTLGLVSQAGGGQTLAFGPSPEFPDSPPEHEIIKEDWVTAVEVVAGVVAAIITAVAASATAGAAGVLAGAAVGALMGAATAALAATPEFIALAGTDDAPAADVLALNILAPLNWPDARHFRLTSADLSDSLRIGGVLWEP